MISKTVLKDILVTNEEHILHRAGRIVPRTWRPPPKGLSKTVIFYGVRRSGKTWILYDIFKNDPQRSIYLDFEDDRLTGFEAADFPLLVECFSELKPHGATRGGILLLDEVQHVVGWERFCRRAVEREGFRVFVSGSSSRLMPIEVHTELRGRSWSVEVLPFSFREYVDAHGVDLSDRKAAYGTGKSRLRGHAGSYVRWGGFPEVALLQSDHDRSALIREYMSAMYFRDLVEKYRISNIALFDSLSDKLFSSASLRLSLISFYNQYKDKVPFSKDLAYSYYKNFLQSMLVYEVRKYSESTYTRMRNPPKIYLADNGLARRVTSEDNGRLLENAAFLELHRRGNELYYFDEGHECDFIARDSQGGLSAYQVAWELTEKNLKREQEGLVAACQRLNVTKGTIITFNESREYSLEGIQVSVIPVWRWWLGE